MPLGQGHSVWTQVSSTQSAHPMGPHSGRDPHPWPGTPLGAPTPVPTIDTKGPGPPPQSAKQKQLRSPGRKVLDRLGRVRQHVGPPRAACGAWGHSGCPMPPDRPAEATAPPSGVLALPPDQPLWSTRSVPAEHGAGHTAPSPSRAQGRRRTRGPPWAGWTSVGCGAGTNPTCKVRWQLTHCYFVELNFNFQ